MPGPGRSLVAASRFVSVPSKGNVRTRFQLPARYETLVAVFKLSKFVPQSTNKLTMFYVMLKPVLSSPESSEFI